VKSGTEEEGREWVEGKEREGVVYLSLSNAREEYKKQKKVRRRGDPHTKRKWPTLRCAV
jgi:hypothetical protein